MHAGVWTQKLLKARKFTHPDNCVGSCCRYSERQYSKRILVSDKVLFPKMQPAVKTKQTQLITIAKFL